MTGAIKAIIGLAGLLLSGCSYTCQPPTLTVPSGAPAWIEAAAYEVAWVDEINRLQQEMRAEGCECGMTDRYLEIQEEYRAAWRNYKGWRKLGAKLRAEAVQ